jgi:hypothetical protein
MILIVNNRKFFLIFKNLYINIRPLFICIKQLHYFGEMSSKNKKKTETLKVENFIDSSFVLDGEAIGKKTTTKISKIIESYDLKNVKKLVWNVNWADNSQVEVASGFSFAVDENTPMRKKIFTPKKMFKATIAYVIDPSKMKFSDGTPVTFQDVIKRLDKIKSSLSSLQLKGANDDGDSFTIQNFDPRNEKYVEVSNYPASMGQGGSFVGIYSSIDRSSYKPNKQLVIASQNYFTVASEALYRYFEEEGSKEKPASWKDVLKSSVVVNAYAAIQANRKKLMAKTIDCIGLEMKDASQKTLIKPTLETETNHFTHNGPTKTYVYHSETLDPETTKGIIFNDIPSHGPKILKGPPSGKNQFGGSWNATDDTYNSFPVNSGRVSLKGDTKISLPEEDIENFTSNSEVKSNWRLSENVYRQRDEAFKNAQYDMGYDKNWGEINLEPIMVRVSNSD